MTNNDRCPDCNGMYSLIGYRHRCTGNAAQVIVTKLPKSVDITLPVVSSVDITCPVCAKRKASLARAQTKWRDKKKRAKPA